MLRDSWDTFCLHWKGIVERKFGSENTNFLFLALLCWSRIGVTKLAVWNQVHTLTVFKSIVKAFLQILFSSLRKELKFIKLGPFIVFIRFIYPGIFCTFEKKKKVKVHKVLMTTFGSSAVPFDSLSFGYWLFSLGHTFHETVAFRSCSVL